MIKKKNNAKKEENVIRVDDFEGGYVEFKNPTVRQAEVLKAFMAIDWFINHIYSLYTLFPNDQELGKELRRCISIISKKKE
jgi:hypothetical protein